MPIFLSPQNVQDAVIGPAFQFTQSKGVQTDVRMLGIDEGQGLALSSSNILFDAMDARATSPGLVGTAGLEAPWWLFWSNVKLAVGQNWTYPIDPLIKGGCTLEGVMMTAEALSGTMTVEMKLQSLPAVGTSSTWTDLGADTQAIGNGQRRDVYFQPGGLVHGVLHSGGHLRYRIRCEITANTSTAVPDGWAVYGLTFVWSSTNMWALMGSATL